MLRLIIIAVICTISLLLIAGYLSHIITNDLLLIAISIGLSTVVVPTILIFIWPAPKGRQHNSKQVFVDDGESINQNEDLNVSPMGAIARRFLSARRKQLFGSKAIFEHYHQVRESELLEVEHKLQIPIPSNLRMWLLLVGYGDVAEELSFRAEWFKPVNFGALKGSALFAQDILGNFYSFDSINGNIYFFSRSAPEYALLAPDFRSFMEELERRDFKVLEWVNSLSVLPYNWTN